MRLRRAKKLAGRTDLAPDLAQNGQFKKKQQRRQTIRTEAVTPIS